MRRRGSTAATLAVQLRGLALLLQRAGTSSQAAVPAAGGVLHLWRPPAVRCLGTCSAARAPAAAAGREPPAPAPSSASEAALALHQAELAQLQRLGLSRPAAAALHKAWASDQLRMPPPGGGLLLSQQTAKDVLPSPPRLLAMVRRLLKAHASAAAQQAPASNTRSRARTPEAAAAAAPAVPPAAPPAADDAKQAVPEWGCLDLQAILTNVPQLAVVAPDLLASRLNALLAGLHPLLGRRLALAFVQQSPRLRLQLHDPAATVSKLVGFRDAYIGVLHAPPRPTLLASSQSSYMAAGVGTFRDRLSHFVDKWGRDMAHSLLSHQPHLLSSQPSTLDGNAAHVRRLLDCDSDVLARIVKRAPRLLSTGHAATKQRLLELVQQLGSAGLAPDDVRRLLFKQPQLMLANPTNVTSRLLSLQALLGPAAHRLRVFILHEPSLLSNRPELLAGRLDRLHALLEVPRDSLCRIIARVPQLLSLSPDNLESKLHALTEVLSADLSAVKRLCATEPGLLVLRPDTLAAKIDAWCAALPGADRGAVIEALRANPRLFSFDRDLVAAHMLALQQLVARSQRWTAGVQPRPRRDSTSSSSSSDDDDGGSSSSSSSDDDVPQPAGAPLPTPVAPLAEDYHSYLRAAKPGIAAQHPDWSGMQVHRAAIAQYKEAKEAVRRARRAAKLRAAPPQRSAGGRRSAGPRSSCWQVYYSRSSSGRLLLRLEFLLATGQQEAVALADALRIAQGAWDERFPEFFAWAQQRLQELRAAPGAWTPQLVDKAQQALDASRSEARARTTAAARRTADANKARRTQARELSDG